MSEILKVRKRDGRIVDFDAERIRLAAAKALKAAGTVNEKIAAHVVDDVIAELKQRGFDKPDSMPDIELIQDIVENSLLNAACRKRRNVIFFIVLNIIKSVKKNS